MAKVKAHSFIYFILWLETIFRIGSLYRLQYIDSIVLIKGLNHIYFKESKSHVPESNELLANDLTEINKIFLPDTTSK